MLYSLKHFKLLSFNFQKSYTGLKVQYSIADAGLKVNHTILEWYLYGNVAYALLCKLINVTLKQTYKDAAVSCYSLTIHKFDLVSMTGLHVATSWVLSTDAYLVSSSHDLSYEELKYYTSLFTKCYNVSS